MVDQSERLASASLFRGLHEPDLKLLLEISHLEMFDSEQIIFQEGDVSHELYVVVDGQIRISRELADGGEEALSILGPGESFGEMSVIDEQEVVRSATAWAHTDCFVLAFEKESFRELLNSNHDLSHVVLWNLVKKLAANVRSSNDKMMLLSGTSRF
jgi:CRP/FNR family cyclic AMP-dependent transcriptional regulator